MYFVGNQNMHDVTPGTNPSCDLTAVAFLIWDTILWAPETPQHSPVIRAALAEL